MTLRKGVFTITCADDGNGYDDVHLPTSTGSRRAQALKVEVDRSAAVGDPNFTISELVEVADPDDTDTSYDEQQLGKQVVFIERGATPSEQGELVDFYDTRVPVQSVFGVRPSTDVPVAPVIFAQNDLRCEVFGGVDGDVFTVTLYYESAGDYRF